MRCAASEHILRLATWPHDGPFGLYPASLFAPASRCHIGRHGADLSRASSSRHYWDGYPANAVAAVAWAVMILAFLPILRFYRLSPLWGAALPLDRFDLFSLHAQIRRMSIGEAGVELEGPQSGAPGEAMTITASIDPSKTEHDENFPVASLPHCAAPASADPELLPFCPRGRRHCRPSRSLRRETNLQA